MSAPEELDARGLRCPLPVLKAQKRLRGMAPGAVLRLVADDPMAAIDAPHFCAQQGHELLEQGCDEAGALWFVIKRNKSPSPPFPAEREERGSGPFRFAAQI